VKLAIEGGCNAVASTLGVLGMTSRKYAHKIPYIVKLNHNELLTYPTKPPSFISARPNKPTKWARQASGHGLFRSDTAQRRSRNHQSFPGSPRVGHVHRPLVLYPQQGLQDKEKDFHLSADLTGQANHLGVTIEADIIKQKLPENNGASCI